MLKTRLAQNAQHSMISSNLDRSGIHEGCQPHLARDLFSLSSIGATLSMPIGIPAEHQATRCSFLVQCTREFSKEPSRTLRSGRLRVPHRTGLCPSPVKSNSLYVCVAAYIFIYKLCSRAYAELGETPINSFSLSFIRQSNGKSRNDIQANQGVR